MPQEEDIMIFFLITARTQNVFWI